MTKRVKRLMLVTFVLASLFLVFAALTWIERESEGPMARFLSGMGAAVSRIEKSVAEYFRGPGREKRLKWFESLRTVPAALRNPPHILLGAYDGHAPRSLEGIEELEATLGTTFPLIHIYTAWGDRPEQHFPSQMMDAIWNLGSVPVVTWEPWLVDFESSRHPHLPLRSERDRGGLASIARGDYDFYIDEWAGEAAAYGKPFFLRFAHEMNDPYRYPWGHHNNSVVDFLFAWRRVHDRFIQARATNVIWVWSPHLAYDYYTYYPGDDYVDWVGTGVINYGTIAPWSEWWTFKEIFGDKYLYLEALKKPIMIAEFATLGAGGDRATWYREALAHLPRRYPAVKALLFFHTSSDATVTLQALDWTIPHDTTTAQVIQGEIARWDTAGPPGATDRR